MAFDVWGDLGEDEIYTPPDMGHNGGPPLDELEIEVAEVLVPALEPRRYKALFGGRGGTKSYFAADYVIAKVMAGAKALCVREIQTSLEQSSKALIEERIDTHGLRGQFRILKTHIEHPMTGGRIEFKGMQQFNAANIKSLQGYSLAWWEEAHTASQYAIDLLIPTIRVAGSELIFTWNPEDPEDPVDAMFRGKNRVSEEEAIVIECSSHTNPWLPDVLRKERDELYRRDPEKAAWVWGGDYRTISDANVLKGLYRAERFEVQPYWDGPYQGLDFGFANDPLAAIRLYVWGKSLYVHYAVGTVSLDLDVTEQYILERIPDWDRYSVRCDNARPESISYLNKNGSGRYSAAAKWPGSVEDGVAWYRQFDEIVVHTDHATPFLKECKRYSYKTNKAGDVLPVIEDKDNHWIDAGRYAAAPLIKASLGSPNVRSL
jgi:phage terminase large subunit